MTQTIALERKSLKLTRETPWVLIAILLHVVVIAVASILYYVHEAAGEDTAPTEIRIAAVAPAIEQIKQEIIDRDMIPKPKVQDADILLNTLEFNPDSISEPSSESNSDEPVSDLSSLMPAGSPGGSAIGPGAGHWGVRPSAEGGRQLGDKSGGRGDRKKQIGSGGGRNQDAVTAGLEWLRLHQDEDGRWDADNFFKHDVDGAPCTGPGNGANDVGVTGLALLAFLGDDNTLHGGPYRKVVVRATRWLLEQQDPATGLLGAPSSQGFMYSHAIASLALCETYGLSEYARLREPAQKAIDYIAHARNPYGVWRYEPKCVDGDASITGWMVQALLSAKEFGLVVDDAALKSALVFFEALTDPATGAAGYTKVGEGSSRPVGKLARFPNAKTEAMTAVVLLCRHLLKVDPKSCKTMELAAQTILNKPMVWNENDGSIDMYYWYYASYALYQAGGRAWTEWSKKMSDVSIKAQKKEGNPKGSWDPVDAWGDDGGRVYSTATMVLCLESFYRYAAVSFRR
jgi:hypothetical protein